MRKKPQTEIIYIRKYIIRSANTCGCQLIEVQRPLKHGASLSAELSWIHWAGLFLLRDLQKRHAGYYKSLC